MKTLRFGFLIVLTLASVQGAARLKAQEPGAVLRPVFLGGPILDFSLPSLQGGEVSLSRFKRPARFFLSRLLLLYEPPEIRRIPYSLPPSGGV